MIASSVLVSAVLAGCIAVLVTLAIERWGGLAGGILGTMPSTILPAAAGIYLAGDEVLFRQSLAIMPLGMLVNGIFLAVWIYLPPQLETVKRPLLSTTVCSLATWLVFGMLMFFGVEYALDYGFSPWGIASVGLMFIIALAVRMNWNIRETPKGSEPVAKSVLVLRGSAAAGAIGAAVWLSSQGQPFIAGLAAVFPAIFLTSMVALWLAQGPTVPRGAAGPMALGGVSVAIYAIIAMYSLPEWGIYIGSAVAWLGAVFGWSLPAYMVLKSRITLD
ncbi:MAG: hypothetical protein L7U62_05820 [Candidatus Poseidoniaceae archaeon]|nr:hypothetical protein [Candidatus Poseidoniaceae archaeon]